MAQTTKSVSGSGTGTHTCPNSTPKSSSISFSASGSTGSWSIPGKAGKITGLQTDGVKYTVTGSETLNVLCIGAGNAQSIQISGDCGTGKPINFVASNGQSGTFTGKVSCNGGTTSCTATSGTSMSTSGSTSTACATSNQPVSCQTSGTGIATATSGSTSTTCPS